MPRLTDATKAARRKQITDAAFECFTTNGYTQTSMSDIIKASGLSSGSIYSHFASKADIFAATIESRLDELEEIYNNLPDTPSPRDILRIILNTSADLPIRANFAAVLRLRLEAASNEELQGLTGTMMSTVRTYIRRAVEPWARIKLSEHSAEEPTQDTVDRFTADIADAFMVIVQGYLVRTTLDSSVNHTHLQQLCMTMLPA
ncbi:MAG: TetR/AcrR family transcriptional regulator [Rothia sp. (in: high G+C Gram-positive bacteria)]|uniref:TetR/AcrR family transcriptional regulator n=1 Tax=Rothia sp. (in: high G+C Gram-positive bacteria) TaxID=1885016 RepID=UPI0026E05598|nr:TetR/AcrR family transcriptional regulator [Rothia sp. (in: high G+C Gram-positive bacteria)]MDO5749694.1 TetR/AcrR family transcriptional regulator [Rothia sp. (in: high G+C Gram-positive bacteria)]